MNNILQTEPARPSSPCPVVEGAERVRTEFGGYLSDESRTAAEQVHAIFLPDTPDQVGDAMRRCRERHWTVAVAGARTGIVGGAVPVDADAVLALEKLNHVNAIGYDPGKDTFTARVEAGVVLADFQEALRTTQPHELPWTDDEQQQQGEKRVKRAGHHLFYPVDPTETSAQIGGTIATNASGARTFHYGATRQWVEGLTVVLASGDILQLNRGDAVVRPSEGAHFILRKTSGEQRTVPVSHLNLPDTKHQAGYHMSSPPEHVGVDAVDLFVGSEGTLGTIVEATLRLTFPPRERLYSTAFFPNEDDALSLVQQVRDRSANGDADEPDAAGIRPLAIEYMGPQAMDLLRDKRAREGASSGVPPLDDDASCAVYLEIAFDGDDEFRACYEILEKLLSENGTSAARTWAGLSAGDLDAMKAFRHAIPEHVNGIIGRRKRDVPALHKVGTDMAVPDEHLRDVIQLYREGLRRANLDHVIFGHIGDNHVHVNILPESEEELDRAMDIYRQFAKEVVQMGGSVAAEHGIGRLKKSFLPIQFNQEELNAMQRLKDTLDPDGTLSPGVLF